MGSLLLTIVGQLFQRKAGFRWCHSFLTVHFSGQLAERWSPASLDVSFKDGPIFDDWPKVAEPKRGPMLTRENGAVGSLFAWESLRSDV